MKTLLSVAPILVAIACMTFGSPLAAEQDNQQRDHQQPRTFKGLHRNEGRVGRPPTVRVSDGNVFIDISEQEYRDRGYAPSLETLSTVFVRRLPVRIRVPDDEAK